MLAGQKLVAFVNTANADGARAFYRDVLGLPLVTEDGFALLFDCGGTPLRVAVAPKVTPAPYTVLGWRVEDLRGFVTGLRAKGVRFERFPPMQQDELGIWTAPGGAQVVWFKDPDGNLLSLARMAE